MLTITIPDDASIALTAAQVVEVRNDAAAAAIGEANTLREQVATVTRERDELSAKFSKTVEDNEAAYMRLYDSVIDALGLKTGDDYIAAIKALKAPPVVVPEVPPVTDAPKLRNIIGITITKDDTPGPKQDAMTRALLDLCSKVGFTHWRGLLNYEEAKAQVTQAEDDPDNLPGYGRRLGMQFVADTVDSQVKRLDKDGLIRYIGWLKKLGAVALYFNDVDDPAKADVIHGWIKRAREAMTAAEFNVPLIGSFTANFDRAKYPGFDQYEIQTFGTLSEFKRFLDMRADFLCIDGQQSATLEYLQKMTALVVEGKRDVWVYSAKDEDTDWRNMPATVEIYRTFVSQWKAR